MIQSRQKIILIWRLPKKIEGKVVETEILEVKLVESFSWAFQVAVPVFVAFVTTYFTHFLLKLQRKKEKQKAKLEKLMNLYIGFQVTGLSAMNTSIITIKSHRSDNFKNFNLGIKLLSKTMYTMLSQWHEIMAVFYNFDFSFVKELKGYIDAVAINIRSFKESVFLFLDTTPREIELKVIDQWIAELEENKKKIEVSTKELTDALKDIDRR